MDLNNPPSHSCHGNAELNLEKTAFLDIELSRSGLSTLDFNILQELRYSPTDVGLLANLASGTSGRSLGECQEAVQRCLDKGLIQQCNDQSLLQMWDAVRESTSIGPVYGFPRWGVLDFTKFGATTYLQLWHGLHDIELKYHPHLRDRQVFSTVVREMTAHYFADGRTAQAFVSSLDLVGETITSIRMAESGPWRRQWWEPLMEGHKVIVETSNPTDMVFKFWHASRAAVNMKLPEIGARSNVQIEANMEEQAKTLEYHDMSWGEWCVLRHLGAEGFSHDDAAALGAASESLVNGLVKLTSSECLRAVDSCIRKGWIWRLTDAVVERIKGRVSGPTSATLLQPIPESNDDVITLSLDGASRFRSVFEAAFGKTSTFDVWRYGRDQFSGGNYGEYGQVIEQQVVEYYALSEQRASRCAVNDDGLFSSETATERVHRRSEPEPIGPWCVYWWKGFPAGWRVEVEFHRSQNSTGQ